MTFWLLALLVFGVGASVTRLITRDSLFEPFRNRWEQHFVSTQDTYIHRAAAKLPADKKYSDTSLSWPERRFELLREIDSRAQDEPAVSFWLRGKQRVKVQPWTAAYSVPLMRLRSLIEFIGCPWCVGFYVFLLAWIFAWGVGLGFAYDVLGAPFWAVLPALALSYRWLYALIASHADAG